jgi:hypothetical protein
MSEDVEVVRRLVGAFNRDDIDTSRWRLPKPLTTATRWAEKPYER